MGGKTATSTSQTTIPPEVLARYNSINTMAQNAASKPYRAFGTQASDFVAQMNQQQNTGINSVNAAAGSYQPYLDAATGATRAGMGSSIDNIQKYMSPYLTNVADTTSALMRQSNEQAQSGALGAAASSGAFGGDRAGIAAANLAGQNQLAMGKTMADIYNQGYGQAASLSQADLARQLQGGAQMAGLGAQAQGLGLQGAQSQLAAGTMQQQTEQAGKDAMLQELMREEGFRFQVPQYLANIATGTGVASGTTTTNQLPRNWLGFSSGGGVSGYADGGGVAGPRTYAQQGFGGEGYVPAADLPVGQLMISNPPEDDSREKTNQMFQMFASAMGAKRGGVIGARHGYAPGGAPETPPAGGVAAAAVPAEPTTGVVPPVARRPPEPTPPGWDTFGPKVAQRESGSDYDALYGFSNRGGGAFEGKNVTGMTINEALEFSNPSGAYGQFVAQTRPDKENGVATPMGAYQIVGKTLRGIKEGMGLTGNELMTPELQDQMAKWLYDNYGESQWAASAPSNGLGGANLNTQVSTMGGGPAAGVKPYEDRNFIGKFFHDPSTGKLNPNAVMALLGGLAKGAEAQTISPLGGILSGLGGGMETYKELLKQTPEVTAANIENTNALQTAYLRAQQLNGYTGTIDEFAKSQGWQNSPFAGGNTGPAPTQGEMFGAPFDFAGQGMRTKIMLDGHEVYAGQSLAWLQSYKNWLNSQSLTGLVDPTLVSSVDRAIEAAKAGSGQISDTSGKVFTDPAVLAGTFGAGQLITAAERTQQILSELSSATTKTQMEDAKLSELSNAVVGMGDTGLIAKALLPYRQIAYELGLADPNDTTVSNQEILRKGLAGDALNQLQAMGGDVATQSYLQQQANATFSDALTKPAIAEILAVRAGINEYNKAFYAYAKEIRRTKPNADLYQAEMDFKASNPLSKFIEEQRPVYKEAILNPPVPPMPPVPEGMTREEFEKLWQDPILRKQFLEGARTDGVN